jgi:chorismate mutase/prephenate dehydratase
MSRPAGPAAGKDPARELDRVRGAIDELDARLVELLNQRARLALEAGRLKGPGAPAHAPEREAAVLRGVAGRGEGPLQPRHLRAVFTEVIAACRSLQQELALAYLGPEGTHSHQAAVRAAGRSAGLRPQPSLAAVFQQVAGGGCRLGLVPVENSCEGPVQETLDLLAAGGLVVCGEVLLPVEHALLSTEPDLAAVHTVYSHPQALAQCDRWLSAHLPGAQRLPAASTALAAVKAAGAPGTAAVASASLAGGGLRLLAGSIQDAAGNQTRFLLLGRRACPPTGRDKTSLVMSLPHRAGTLQGALQVLADAGLNLCRIVSRPLPGRPGEYRFHLDFWGHRDQPATARALEDLRALALELTVLGSYPAAAEEAAGHGRG